MKSTANKKCYNPEQWELSKMFMDGAPVEFLHLVQQDINPFLWAILEYYNDFLVHNTQALKAQDSTI
jgi:hypothetical protein